MKTLFATLMNMAMVATAFIFAPALFLRYRALGDPEGLIDGMLRVSWWMPLAFLVCLWLFAGGRLRLSQGLLPIYLPLLLTLSAVGVGLLGYPNDSTVIVSHAARPLNRAEQLRRAKGELVWEESDFGWIAPVATFARRHLPKQPFGQVKHRALPAKH